MKNMIKFVPIFTYQLALFLQNEGWVIHHTAPNVSDPKRKVYYFIFAPGIYDDISQFKNFKEDKSVKHITKTFKGEPDYLIPIYDNKMVRYLLDLGFKIERVEVYISEVDNSKRRVTYFKYQRGFYSGIQRYLNRMNKMNRKKAKKKKDAQEGN